MASLAAYNRLYTLGVRINPSNIRPYRVGRGRALDKIDELDLTMFGAVSDMQLSTQYTVM
jgi:hypothetical protein